MSSYLGQQSVNDFGAGSPELMYSANLASGTPLTFTVPVLARRYKAVLSYQDGTNVFVSYNGVNPALPGVAFAAVNYELNPDCREVTSGSELRFLTSSATAFVTISLYPINVTY